MFKGFTGDLPSLRKQLLLRDREPLPCDTWTHLCRLMFYMETEAHAHTYTHTHAHAYTLTHTHTHNVRTRAQGVRSRPTTDSHRCRHLANTPLPHTCTDPSSSTRTQDTNVRRTRSRPGPDVDGQTPPFGRGVNKHFTGLERVPTQTNDDNKPPLHPPKQNRNRKQK